MRELLSFACGGYFAHGLGPFGANQHDLPLSIMQGAKPVRISDFSRYVLAVYATVPMLTACGGGAGSSAMPAVSGAAADRRISNLVLTDSEAGKAGRARPVMVLSSSAGSNEKLKPKAPRFRDMCSCRNDRGLRPIAAADRRDGRDAAFHRPHAEKPGPKRRPRKGHGGVRLRRQRLFQQCFRVCR